MLYDVITNHGYVIAHNVMLGKAKPFLRAYYKGYSSNPAFAGHLVGWMAYGSMCGGEPYVVAHIELSKNV